MKKSTEGALVNASSFLGCDKEEFKEALTSRVMQATRGGAKGTVIKWVKFPWHQISENLFRIHEMETRNDMVSTWIYLMVINLHQENQVSCRRNMTCI